MTITLHVECDPMLGGRIDRDMPNGHAVTVAHVKRRAGGLVVHRVARPESEGLDYLEGLHAMTCEELLERIGRPDVAATSPIIIR